MVVNGVCEGEGYLCIGVAYNQRINSNYKSEIFLMIFSELSEVLLKYPNAEVIIMRDFIARVGKWDLTVRLMHYINILLTRSNSKIENYANKELINVCVVHVYL